jgi:hypothetical protein
MKKPAAILILLLMGLPVQAQEFRAQRRGFVAANVGINGVVGGMGALTNKKKDEKSLKVFLKGFGQGCLGGAFHVLGRQWTYQINSKNNLSYAWAARLTNAVGSSITQNAASNLDFWERWHFNLGLVRFDYHVPDQKFQARLFPSAVYGVIIAGSQARFSLKRTLQTGILVYQGDRDIRHLGLEARAAAIVSSVPINRNLAPADFYYVMAHETMHIIQYDSMLWTNPFFNQLDAKWKAKSSAYRNLSRYVYFDFNGVTILATYLTQVNRPWVCRYLEREADHFSQKIALPDCN